MGNRGEGECSSALHYCQDNYSPLLERCRHAMKVRRFTNYMNDGEDLAQTVCQSCGAITNEQWSAIEDHEAYVSAMIRNAANLAFKTKNGAPLTNFEDLDPPPNRMHSDALEAALLLKELLDTLPEDRRNLLEMAEVEELTGRELAELLNLPHNTIRQRLSRTRRGLKSLLSKADANPRASRVKSADITGKGATSNSHVEGHDSTQREER